MPCHTMKHTEIAITDTHNRNESIANDAKCEFYTQIHCSLLNLMQAVHSYAHFGRFHAY